MQLLVIIYINLFFQIFVLAKSILDNHYMINCQIKIERRGNLFVQSWNINLNLQGKIISLPACVLNFCILPWQKDSFAEKFIRRKVHGRKVTSHVISSTVAGSPKYNLRAGRRCGSTSQNVDNPLIYQAM